MRFFSIWGIQINLSKFKQIQVNSSKFKKIQENSKSISMSILWLDIDIFLPFVSIDPNIKTCF